MTGSFHPASCEWLRDLPDPRDSTLTDECVREMLSALPARPRGRSVPVDWQSSCPPTWASDGVPASTAMACAALVSCFQRRAYGRLFVPSWWFLHRMACVLDHRPANTPTSFRQTLKALVRFGLPPMEYHRFDAARREETPDAFLFSFAREYAELRYVRLDRPHCTPEQLLVTVKKFLTCGFAVGFGVSLFDSLGTGPAIEFPSAYGLVRGGTALVAVGWHDTQRIGLERGGLRVRCPWGPSWGEGGYGWLPFRYLEEGLACDFWTLLRKDWLARDEFHNPL